MKTYPYYMAVTASIEWKLAILSLSNYAKRLVNAERTSRYGGLDLTDPVYLRSGERR